MTLQHVPTVTRADVDRLVRRDFPHHVTEVLSLLTDYGPDNDTQRVRAAILKLAKGNLGALRHEIAVADNDPRDVLAYAEYPGYMRRVPGRNKLPPDQEKQIIDADWAQYQEWFTRQ